MGGGGEKKGREGGREEGYGGTFNTINSTRGLRRRKTQARPVRESGSR